MGTWGYDPLDSDAALDARHIWDSYVRTRLESEDWTEDDVVRYFKEKRWGDAVRCGDNITNSEIIAVLEIFRSEGLGIPRELKRIAEDAINRELVEAELETWKDPEARRGVLLRLLEGIEGREKAPRKVRMFKDPSIEFPNKAVAERELMKLTSFGKKLLFNFDIHNNPDLGRDLPPFVATLNRFVHHGTWEKDSNLALEAVGQRLMMLAYYLGMSLGYDDDRIRELIDDAKWEKK